MQEDSRIAYAGVVAVVVGLVAGVVAGVAPEVAAGVEAPLALPAEALAADVAPPEQVEEAIIRKRQEMTDTAIA